MFKKYLVFASVVCAALTACRPSSTHYQGYAQVQNAYMASVHTGTLQHLAVKRGQPLVKGQLLFALDPNPERILFENAKDDSKQDQFILDDLIAHKRAPEIDEILAKIKQAQAQVNLATLRVKRNQMLIVKHVVPQDTLDESIERLDEVTQLKAQYMAQLDLAKLGSRENQIRAQVAKVSALRQEVKKYAWDVAQKTVYAPFDGYVFDTFYVEGELVPAQQPVLSLFIPRNVRLEFFVPAEALPGIHVDQAILARSDAGGPAVRAHISYVSSEAEYVPPLVYSNQNLQKLIFRIKAIPDDPMFFKPGEPLDIEVTPVFLEPASKKPIRSSKVYQSIRSWLHQVMSHNG